MVEFNENDRNQQLEDIREKEAERLAEMLSKKHGLPYTDLTIVPINVGALKVITEEKAREANLAAFNLRGKKVDLGVLSPHRAETHETIERIRERGYEPILHLVSARSLEHAWDRYKDITSASESTKGTLSISDAVVAELKEKVENLDDVTNTINDVLALDKTNRTTRIAEASLAGGLALKASDVHIEPHDEDVRIRFRLDGVLTDVATIDPPTFKLLASRLKLLSGLKINVDTVAQDGRFSIKIGDDDIEIRTSVLPGPNGEAIVMRILNPNTISMGLSELGINSQLLEIIMKEIKRPNGMILTTGPTGSGKTTTLYAFLREVYSPETKIITIENPIEYHLAGIVQTQVDAEANYTFLAGLRSALRQDPDIIMVGEIRDDETANTAINAALTGHLVFSTLHTNTAAAAFPRLLSLGVNPKVVTSAINLTLAQRLIRQLCPHCKKEVPLESTTKEKIEAVLASITNQSYLEGVQKEKIWTAVGCDECSGVGYKGRVGVYEGILTDAAIEQVVQKNPSDREIRNAATDQHLLTMAQDGVLKVLQGVTDLDELERVIDLSEL